MVQLTKEKPVFSPVLLRFCAVRDPPVDAAMEFN
jgi:hypothetical protein